MTFFKVPICGIVGQSFSLCWYVPIGKTGREEDSSDEYSLGGARKS